MFPLKVDTRTETEYQVSESLRLDFLSFKSLAICECRKYLMKMDIFISRKVRLVLRFSLTKML